MGVYRWALVPVLPASMITFVIEVRFASLTDGGGQSNHSQKLKRAIVLAPRREE